MQYTVIRLAFKCLFWGCMTWVTNICKYLYILCNSWPQILTQQSKKALFKWLPRYFGLHSDSSFSKQPMDQNLVSNVSCGIFLTLSWERETMNQGHYIACIKINHLLTNCAFGIKSNLGSWTFDMCSIHQLSSTPGSMGKNTLQSITSHASLAWLKKQKTTTTENPHKLQKGHPTGSSIRSYTWERQSSCSIQGCAAIQWDLDRLQRQAWRNWMKNGMKSNTDKSRVLHLANKNPTDQ